MNLRFSTAGTDRSKRRRMAVPVRRPVCDIFPCPCHNTRIDQPERWTRNESKTMEMKAFHVQSHLSSPPRITRLSHFLIQPVLVCEWVQLKFELQLTVQPNCDRPTTCVIAQQYSSATFASLCFHSSKEDFMSVLKCYYFMYFTFFKAA